MINDMEKYDNFENAIADIHYAFKHDSYKVHTEKWQGVEIAQKPEAAMHELLNYNFSVELPTEDLDFYMRDIKPNLPWADDHFLERVCGEPLNPGVQWAKWPWGNSADSFRAKNDGPKCYEGQFDHNYMERYWPKFAGQTRDGGLDRAAHADNAEDYINKGIRNDYGDLRDVINQLNNEPQTRQAYFPIFFPEDTGAVHGGRVPCSLGYHFIYRHGLLHINYYLRSCEVYRHFRDDCYLTLRLLMYVLDELRKLDKKWEDVRPGTYSMYITSFHCFVNDLRSL